ncbi:DUF5915 domain-containing protein [Streptomyces sp. NPDC091219]|uniref:DUF5915 domain-containing protein n=1 Tax=Streptomyces sp. NPDC091219 TaxID=3155193 RepID=UPI00344DB523
MIRVIQQARREADLDVSDRIALSLAAPPAVLVPVRDHQEFIAQETLAVSVTLVDALSEGFTGTVGAGKKTLVRVVRT